MKGYEIIAKQQDKKLARVLTSSSCIIGAFTKACCLLHDADEENKTINRWRVQSIRRIEYEGKTD